MRWIYSTNAKDIAIMYLIFSIFSAIIGTIFSIVIRTEMGTSGNQIINNGNIYNVVIAAHGLIMIFFFIMPSLFGSFGNYFVPVYVGALDTAFPRINNFAFWLLPPSILLLLISAFIENGPGVGWTVGYIKPSYIYIIDIITIIYFINIARCGKILYSDMNTNIIYKYIVKISFTWGQSAWFIIWYIYVSITIFVVGIYIEMFKQYEFNNNPSETKRNDYSYINNSGIKFEPWLVGVTDGDGTFFFNNSKKDVWVFSFQIAQSNYNLRLLYFIKKMIGVGEVSIPKDGNCYYRVRVRENIIKYILPIFDKYSLLTSKNYNYKLFREAILIYDNSNISREDKHERLKLLKAQHKSGIPNGYISPIWEIVNYSVTCIDDAIKVINKSWLVGFVEAEGSFFISKKDTDRYTHGFTITQKLDPIVLIGISYILGLRFCKSKWSFYYVTTYTLDNIKYISEYFTNTMKGMKSLEFQIWKRSFTKRHKGWKYLFKVQYLMRKIRNKGKLTNLVNLNI